MEISLCEPNLLALDALRADTLVSVVFADERPLRGASALADWRLCGLISKALMRGWFRGSFGEALLISPQGRLPMQRVLLLGAGLLEDFDAERMRSLTEKIGAKLKALGSRVSAWVLPGRHLGLLSAEDAASAFFATVKPWLDQEEVVLIEELHQHRHLLPFLEKERRKIRAPGKGLAAC